MAAKLKRLRRDDRKRGPRATHGNVSQNRFWALAGELGEVVSYVRADSAVRSRSRSRPARIPTRWLRTLRGSRSIPEKEGPPASMVGSRSRAAPPWGTRKPRRRSRRPQTRVQRLAKNHQNRGPTQRRNSPGHGPERVGKAVDAKHAGRGHQEALETTSRCGAGGQGSKKRRGPSGAAKEAEAGKGRSDIREDGYDAVLYGGVRRRPARRRRAVRKYGA